jgi:TRAP-type C4-dicarboxylate transport system substrate-binding protein
VAAIEFVPFVFPTREKAWAALDGALGANTREQIDAMGLHAFDKNFALGFYQITNSVRPIRSVDDMAGLKIRVGPAKLALDTFRSLGAAPTPLNFSELYSALQTHVVDGQYNPYAIIEVSRFFEVQKYLTEVNLCWASYYMMANGDAWKALPPDIQAVVGRNADKYAVLQRRDTALLNESLADKLTRLGMQRNDAATAGFRAKLRDAKFYERWRAEFGSAAWDLLEAHTGKLA